MGTQKNRLNETVPFSTQNTCLNEWVRNKLKVYANKTARPPDKSVYWNIIFFISHPKHMVWVLKRTVSMRRSLEHPKHMFKLMGKKTIKSLRK